MSSLAVHRISAI